MYGSLGRPWYMGAVSGHVSCRPRAAPFLWTLTICNANAPQMVLGGVDAVQYTRLPFKGERHCNALQQENCSAECNCRIVASEGWQEWTVPSLNTPFGGERGFMATLVSLSSSSLSSTLPSLSSPSQRTSSTDRFAWSDLKPSAGRWKIPRSTPTCYLKLR